MLSLYADGAEGLLCVGTLSMLRAWGYSLFVTELRLSCTGENAATAYTDDCLS